MDFTNVDTDDLMVATIHAAHGVYTHLKEVLKAIISPIGSVRNFL
jgi:hypothetical protein